MEVVGIILDLLLIVLLCYGIFFKSYFTEKGKNLATKEDISDITTKIENIKLLNSKELEEFKVTIINKIELSKAIIESKTSVYKELVQLKSLLLMRSNNLGDEKEQIPAIFELIDRVLLKINSDASFSEEIKNKSIALQIERNSFMGQIEILRNRGATRYSISLDSLLSIIDSLQVEVLK
ncbi:MAG: hypothetical protein WCY89_02620 [Flavobacteriaceae bacterium]